MLQLQKNSICGDHPQARLRAAWRRGLGSGQIPSRRSQFCFQIEKVRALTLLGSFAWHSGLHGDVNRTRRVQTGIFEYVKSKEVEFIAIAIFDCGLQHLFLIDFYCFTISTVSPSPITLKTGCWKRLCYSRPCVILALWVTNNGWGAKLDWGIFSLIHS
jgi:hypothetical protein